MRKHPLIASVLILFTHLNAAKFDSPLQILIVSGQFNALNIHCDAALLESDPADTSIMFYFHSGIPPQPQLDRLFFDFS